MALSGVKFKINQNGLGIVSQSEDDKSAMLFSGIAKPTAFGTAKMKSYTAIEQVVADGITADSAVHGLVHYQAKEYWRISPNAELHIGFGIADAEEFYGYTRGKVHQLGVSISQINDAESIWQSFANVLMGKYAPIQIMAAYEPPTATVPTVASLPNLGDDLSANNVSILICGDHAAGGAALATALGRKYVPALGATLGAMSAAKVSENIGWVQRFNLSDKKELERVRLFDGTESTDPVELVLDGKRYLTLRKYVGFKGTYVEKDHTATDPTSDYSNIRNNLTIQKAIRGIRVRMLPLVKSPVLLDPETGQLSPETVEYFEDTASLSLKQMQQNGEISGYKVVIDPNQNVLVTAIIMTKCKIIPLGSADFIDFEIGMETSLNN